MDYSFIREHEVIGDPFNLGPRHDASDEATNHQTSGSRVYLLWLCEKWLKSARPRAFFCSDPLISTALLAITGKEGTNSRRILVFEGQFLATAHIDYFH